MATLIKRANRELRVEDLDLEKYLGLGYEIVEIPQETETTKPEKKPTKADK